MNQRKTVEFNGVMLTRKEYKALPVCEMHMGKALNVYAMGGAFVCKSCIQHKGLEVSA